MPLGPQEYTIHACSCESSPIVLIRNGLFPCSPTAPRRAISLDLLDLFLSVQEQSSDSVRSLATALAASYRNRGFPLVDKQTVRLTFLSFRLFLINATEYRGGESTIPSERVSDTH